MTSKLTEEQLEDLRRHYAEDWVETVASEAFSEHVRAIFQKLEHSKTRHFKHSGSRKRELSKIRILENSSFQMIGP